MEYSDKIKIIALLIENNDMSVVSIDSIIEDAKKLFKAISDT